MWSTNRQRPGDIFLDDPERALLDTVRAALTLYSPYLLWSWLFGWWSDETLCDPIERLWPWNIPPEAYNTAPNKSTLSISLFQNNKREKKINRKFYFVQWSWNAQWFKWRLIQISKVIIAAVILTWWFLSLHL